MSVCVVCGHELRVFERAVPVPAPLGLEPFPALVLAGPAHGDCGGDYGLRGDLAIRARAAA